MRLAFASDFHGSLRHFSSFLDLARQQGAAVAIVGGDLFPGGRPYEEMLRLQRQFVNTSLRDIVKDHRDLGGCPVHLMPGNNDMQSVFVELEGFRQEGLVAVPGPAVHPLSDGYVLVALPHVPPTPFRLKDFEKRDLPTDPIPTEPNPVFLSAGDEVRPVDVGDYFSQHLSIEEELCRLGLAKLEAAKTIYVMHSPPFRTGLDRTAGGSEVGSRAIRAAIETHQPLLTLHGHIHEAPTVSGAYACRLGRTISANPGQSRDTLLAVIAELAEEVSLSHTTLGAVSFDDLKPLSR